MKLKCLLFNKMKNNISVSFLLVILTKHIFFTHWRVSESQSLQSALVVDDGKVEGFVPSIDGDEELRPVLQVSQLEDVPLVAGQPSRPVRADETELLGQTKRKNTPVKQKHQKSLMFNSQLKKEIMR